MSFHPGAPAIVTPSVRASFTRNASARDTACRSWRRARVYGCSVACCNDTRWSRGVSVPARRKSSSVSGFAHTSLPTLVTPAWLARWLRPVATISLDSMTLPWASPAPHSRRAEGLRERSGKPREPGRGLRTEVVMAHSLRSPAPRTLPTPAQPSWLQLTFPTPRCRQYSSRETWRSAMGLTSRCGMSITRSCRILRGGRRLS